MSCAALGSVFVFLDQEAAERNLCKVPQRPLIHDHLTPILEPCFDNRRYEIAEVLTGCVVKQVELYAAWAQVLTNAAAWVFDTWRAAPVTRGV